MAWKRYYLRKWQNLGRLGKYGNYLCKKCNREHDMTTKLGRDHIGRIVNAHAYQRLFIMWKKAMWVKAHALMVINQPSITTKEGK